MLWKIAGYVLVTFLLTGILAVIQEKTKINFQYISLPQLAPAITVLIFFFIYKFIPSPLNISINKTVAIKTIIAFVLPLILFTITFLTAKQTGVNVKLTDNLSKLLPVMVAGMLIGAFGEEIGWRSFLQPMLESKNSPLTASIIIGIIWGLWHVGHYQNGFLFMIGFLLFTVSASIIIAWLLQGTQYNLIIASLFHLSINIGFIIFFYNSLSDSRLMLINGIIWLIPAAGIIILTGKDLLKI